MLGPVGNSPGPDLIGQASRGGVADRLPLESTTLTKSHASCVPSTAESVVVLAVRFNAAAVPAVGQVGGGTLA